MLVSIRTIVALTVVMAACAPPPARPMPPLTPDAYAHYLRGRAAYFEADYGTALAELDEAAMAAPDQAGVAVARAEAMYRLGRRVDAGVDIDRATQRWPRSAEVWLAAGDIHRGAGEVKRAARAYRRALELNPRLANAYLGLAAAETQARRPEAAERVYRELIAALPENVDGHEQLALILLARRDDRGAAAELRRVIELDGDRLDAHRALAGVHVRAGRLGEAIAATRVAFDRSGGDLAIGADLMWLFLEAGDRRAALDLLVLYDDTSPPAVEADVAELYLAIGELPRALEAARSAARRGRDTALVQARVLIALGRHDDAIATADTVEPHRKVWPTAQALAIEALLAAGRVDEARARAAAALERSPDHLAVVAAAAELARRTGDAPGGRAMSAAGVAGGRAIFRRAAAAEPHDAELALAWAAFESRAGDHGRALALAEQVLAATPDAPGALNQVGYILVELRRDLPRARRLLVRARGLAPGDPSVLDSWGWLLRAEGDLAAADRALTRAVAIAPHEPEIRAHASTVARERGALARAARLSLPSCYARAHMKTPALLRIVLGSLLATAACKDAPSKSECEQLLAHLVALESAATGDKPSAADKAASEKQQAAVRDYATGLKFIDTCTRGTPKSVVKCGLAAKTMDEVAKCDQAQ